MAVGLTAEVTSCCWPVTAAEVGKADLLALAAVAVVEKTDSTAESDARALELLAELQGELAVLEAETLELLAAWTAFSGVCNQLAAVGCNTAAVAALVEPLLQQVPAAVAEQLEELLAAAAELAVLEELVAERKCFR